MTESANAAIRYELATGDQDNLTINPSDFDHSIRIYIFIFAGDYFSPGTTVWTSVRSTWSGRRNLVEADNNSSMTFDVADVKDSLQSHEVLQSTLPSWCLFRGMG